MGPVIVMDDLLREFLIETAEHLDTVDVELVRFEKNPADQAILRHIFRLVHTVKGTCGFLGLPRLENLAHAAEALIEQLREGRPATSDVVTLLLATVDRIKLILAELDLMKAEPAGFDRDLIGAIELTVGAGEAPGTGDAPPAEPSAREDASEPRGPTIPTARSVRVGVDLLEQLTTTMSELVGTRDELLAAARRHPVEDAFGAPLRRLAHITAELQRGILQTRMQPIGSAWAKLPRVVRDLSVELGREIELVLRGGHTELDRQILDTIRDPLTHMVRNSADHGIEPPAERIAGGKPAAGTIALNAHHDGDTVTIEVSDDGRGLDLGAIRQRALDSHLTSPAELSRMSDDEVAAYIFRPGFSTSRAINCVSGRGVGMDVVRTNVALVGGTVAIASEPGRGTTFTIRIPLTLARPGPRPVGPLPPLIP